MMSSKIIRGILIDLSGTIHVDEEAISGSVAAVKRLYEAQKAQTTGDGAVKKGLEIRFVTNTSKESSASLLARLSRLGLDPPPSHIFSSLTAARAYLLSGSLRPLLLLSEDSLSDFAGIPTENPNAVVLGLAPDVLDYPHLNEAFRLIMRNPEAELIAVNKSRYMKVAEGQLSLGTGAFVAALEFASGRPAKVIGKPSEAFFATVLKDMGCQPHEAVMIGDDLLDDIGGAQRAGLKGFLVRTGKFRAEDERNEKVQPDGIFNNLEEAVHHILNEQ